MKKTRQTIKYLFLFFLVTCPMFIGYPKKNPYTNMLISAAAQKEKGTTTETDKLHVIKAKLIDHFTTWYQKTGQEDTSILSICFDDYDKNDSYEMFVFAGVYENQNCSGKIYYVSLDDIILLDGFNTDYLEESISILDYGTHKDLLFSRVANISNLFYTTIYGVRNKKPEILFYFPGYPVDFSNGSIALKYDYVDDLYPDTTEETAFPDANKVFYFYGSEKMKEYKPVYSRYIPYGELDHFPGAKQIWSDLCERYSDLIATSFIYRDNGIININFIKGELRSYYTRLHVTLQYDGQRCKLVEPQSTTLSLDSFSTGFAQLYNYKTFKGHYREP